GQHEGGPEATWDLYFCSVDLIAGRALVARTLRDCPRAAFVVLTRARPRRLRAPMAPIRLFLLLEMFIELVTIWLRLVQGSLAFVSTGHGCFSSDSPGRRGNWRKRVGGGRSEGATRWT